MIQLLRKIFLLFALLLTFVSCSSEKNQPLPETSAALNQTLFSGTIDLDPKLRNQADSLAILFLIARTPDGGVVAVKKLLPPFQYPLSFAMTAEDVMIPGSQLPEQFKLLARLDKDGDANPTQPGDIIGSTEDGMVRSGEKNVKILLNELVTTH